MVEILHRYLEPIAYRIDEAFDLKTGLRMIDEQPYTIVILDLKFPETDQQDSLDAIRVFKRHNAAVVVVSGVVNPTIKDEVMAAGADAFVAKDNKLTQNALLIATNIATLHLPKEAYVSESYLGHVALLRQMVKQP